MAMAPAPSAAPAQPATCPSCHGPVDAGSRFCSRCGAALGAPGPGLTPAAAPSSPPPVDIRESVDADRGFLKRLQLLIPGFRGYRLGEDIRTADSFLRLQIADKIHQLVLFVQDSRATLTQAGQFASLTDLAAVLSDLQKVEGEVRFAEQGYTGLAPAIRIQPEQLDRLYQYDYGFAVAADQLLGRLDPLRAAIQSNDAPAMRAATDALRSDLRRLETAFQARLRAVEGILVP